jgi:hypothetical protein
MQIGTILAQYAPGTTQGYARVTRTSGTNPFIVYAVINDGGQPGERSGDGAFISSSLKRGLIDSPTSSVIPAKAQMLLRNSPSKSSKLSA